MDHRAPNLDRFFGGSDSARQRITQGLHVQSPLPRIPLFGMNESNIAKSSYEWYPILGLCSPSASPVVSQHENPKESWMTPSDQPNSPMFPPIQSSYLLGPQLLTPCSLVSEDAPDDHTYDYLTDINFDDPTKPPYPKFSVIPVFKHRLLQNLAHIDPSVFQQNIQEATYARQFTQAGQLLDELALITGFDMRRRWSYDAIVESLEGSGKEHPPARGLRILEILDAMSYLEWESKKDLGRGLAEWLKYDKRTRNIIAGRARLVLIDKNEAGQEGEHEIFADLFEALFDLDCEDAVTS